MSADISKIFVLILERCCSSVIVCVLMRDLFLFRDSLEYCYYFHEQPRMSTYEGKKETENDKQNQQQNIFCFTHKVSVKIKIGIVLFLFISFGLSWGAV